MKVLVVGGAGKMGAAIVREAVGRGLEAAAYVRDRSKARDLPSSVPVFEGDGRDGRALDAALAGQDAVVVPAGGRVEPVTAEIVQTLLPLLEKHGIARVIVISAYGALEPKGFYGWIMRNMASAVSTDKTKAEGLLQGSSLQWTAVRPGILTDAEKSGKVRAEVGRRLKGMPRISRADVAEFVADELIHPRFIAAAPIVFVDGTQR